MFVIAMRRMALTAVVLGLMIGAARPAKANYVVNGGFETGDFTGWTLSGNPAAAVIGFNRESGNFAASFGAAGDLAYLSQNLMTTAGQSYALSFWLYNLGEPTNEFTVSVNGQTLLDQHDLQPFLYTPYTLNFTASALAMKALSTPYTLNFTASAPTMLTFGFRNDPANFVLDDVAVEKVPELDPGSMAGALTLLSGGVLALTDRCRRRAVA